MRWPLSSLRDVIGWPAWAISSLVFWMAERSRAMKAAWSAAGGGTSGDCLSGLLPSLNWVVGIFIVMGHFA